MSWQSPHNRKLPDIKSNPALMGILNLTPDSFSDGGKFSDIDAAIKQVSKMISEGADLIDIGAESTRPNANTVDEAEELLRLEPLIIEIRKNFHDIPLSIDTYKPNVAARAIELGADIINDVSGGRFASKFSMPQMAAKFEAPIILMDNLPCKKFDAEIIDEVKGHLLESLEFCAAAGVKKNQIIIDVGFGFGKNLEQNWILLRRLNEFRSLNLPILLGISRKRMLSDILCNTPENRDLETSIANAYALFNNSADIFRVHSIRETKAAFNIYKNLNNKING